jgi:uncharacterized membrane protein
VRDKGFSHRKLAGFALVALATLMAAPASVTGEAPASGESRIPPGHDGNFVFHDGDFRPLADIPRAAITGYLGMNNRGQSVGSYVDAEGRFHGFLRDRRRIIPLDVPRATDTFPWHVNDRGQIVGMYFDERGQLPDGSSQHGFLWNRGRFTTIDPPDAVAFVQVYSIDERGRIVGAYYDSADVQHGFLLEDGVYTRIDPPGAVGTKAVGINERGQIVGIYGDANAIPGPDGTLPAGTVHGFLFDRGTFIDIDPPDALAAGASAINSSGEIVGQFVDADGVVRAFYRSRRGAFVTITPPGERPDTFASDINERGQIVIPAPGTGFEALLNGGFQRRHR